MSKTILIVDDSMAIRRILENALTRVGLKVLAASNARAALELLLNTPKIWVVISDLHMPFMNGMEFITEARQHGIGIPMFILSSDTSSSLREGHGRQASRIGSTNRSTSMTCS